MHTTSEGSDQTTDVQTDPSLRTSYILGFVMHRHANYLCKP